MKFNSLHIIFILVLMIHNALISQQRICAASIHQYSVDLEENNGAGTSGSTYEWYVSSDNFLGSIIYHSPSSNQITIDWGDTPPDEYVLLVTETNSEGCTSQSKMKVFIEKTPKIELEDQFLCPNGGEVVLSAPENFEGYEWIDPEGNSISNTSEVVVNEPGIYILNVFDGRCYYQTQEQIHLVDLPTIEIATDENNTVTVTAIGTYGPYLYQLETIDSEIISPYQLSNVFFNVEPGIYLVRVLGLQGDCENEEIAVVLFIPNIITPNKDQVNDQWHIKGLVYFPDSVVEVYDRYGKLLTILNAENRYTWDGYYMGRALPSDTYWYRIIFKDGTIRKGWVTIKNRNSIN